MVWLDVYYVDVQTMKKFFWPSQKSWTLRQWFFFITFPDDAEDGQELDNNQVLALEQVVLEEMGFVFSEDEGTYG